MYQLIYGPATALAGHPLLNDPDALRLEVDPVLLPAWGGARALLAALRARGVDVDAAVEPVRIVLGVCLDGLSARLPLAERRTQAEVEAQPLGFMAHNGMVIAPVLEAWVQALAPHCAHQTLIIPRLDAIDVLSLAVLRGINVRLPVEARPTVRIGIDPLVLGGPESLWSGDFDNALGAVTLIEGLPDTALIRLPPDADPRPPAPPRVEATLDDLDSGPELRAWRRLQDPAPLDADAIALIRHGMDRAFAAYGFTAALRLGIGLAERAPTALDRDAHTLIGLAAYNRQVRRSASAEGLPELLDHHFRAALAGEPDPAKRSHLGYRLCINVGRRKGDLPEALAIGDAAVADAQAPGIAPGMAAFLEAWARNGRAYVYARMGRGREALEDCEIAWDLLATAEEAPGAPPSEVLPSRMVIADNLGRVCMMRRDHAGAARWQAEHERLEQRLGGFAFTTFRWLELDRTDRNLAQARERAERALRAAQAGLAPENTDYFAAELGDLSFRQGDLDAARRWFEESLKVRERIGLAEDRLVARMSLLIARLYADALTTADLDPLLADPGYAEPAAQAQLHLLRARVIHRQGGDPAAAMDAAIDAAVEAGDRDVLLTVARVAGDLSRAAGALGEAADAYARALEIAEAEVDGDAAPPPAEVLAVHLGRWRMGIGDPTPILDRVDAALEEPELWWRLDELAAVAAMGPVDHPARAIIEQARAQRLDAVNPAPG